MAKARCTKCNMLYQTGKGCTNCVEAKGKPLRTRDYTDENQRRQILADHIKIRGNVCLGWEPFNHKPHHTDDLTVHHLVARAKGGTLDQGYTIICRSINSKIGSRT